MYSALLTDLQQPIFQRYHCSWRRGVVYKMTNNGVHNVSVTTENDVSTTAASSLLAPIGPFEYTSIKNGESSYCLGFEHLRSRILVRVSE